MTALSHLAPSFFGFNGKFLLTALLLGITCLFLPRLSNAGPPNSINIGDRWICMSGFKRQGSQCLPINIPPNAFAYGERWLCNTGYKRVGNACQRIAVPPNAFAYGERWLCNTGYKRVGSACQKIAVPPNAMAVGNRWICKVGFKFNPSKTGCLKMTAQEAAQQIKLLNLHRAGYLGNPCDRAYNRCVSECPTSIYDYENSRYVSNTDANSKCEDACSTGQSNCEGESRDERCEEFQSGCSSDCPSTVYDYNSGDFLLLTDINSKCEDACQAGQYACE